jgi:cold shock CspA family protein
MLWFNEAKDHGFISTSDGERLSVYGTAFPGGPPKGPCAGLVVEFEVTGPESKREATNVTFPVDVPGMRARLRRGGRGGSRD